MASISLLEKRIDRQMKENADQMKYFKSELYTLKTHPKLKVQRPASELIKAKELSKCKKPEPILKVAAKGNGKSSISTPVSRQAVKKSHSIDKHCSISIYFRLYKIIQSTMS